MRQQLGLGLSGVGKVHGQHLRNALVELLPGAPEQRLVRRVLDQCMLEHVRRLWGHTSLCDQLGIDKLRERPLKRRLIQRRYSLHQVIAKVRPMTAPSCATSFAAARRSNRAISASCRVAGIANGGKGPAKS